MPDNASRIVAGDILQIAVNAIYGGISHGLRNPRQHIGCCKLIISMQQPDNITRGAANTLIDRVINAGICIDCSTMLRSPRAAR